MGLESGARKGVGSLLLRVCARTAALLSQVWSLPLGTPPPPPPSYTQTQALFCALALGAASFILTAVPQPIAAAAFTAAAAAAGLLIAGAHIGIPAFVHLTHHGRKLLNHHPWADAFSSTALCLSFIAATALLFHASNMRGCVLSASRAPGAGAGLSFNGTASKEAQLSFSLDDQVHQWPSAGDQRSQARVGWTMLVEVLFAGQLNAGLGQDPAFQQQLAGHIKRIWSPYTTSDRAMNPTGQNETLNADDAAMVAIFDAGQIGLNPRGGSNGTLAPFAPVAAGRASDSPVEPTDEQLDAYVTIRPDEGSANLVGPEFVGYDMIETTLRAYAANESPEFLRRIGPYVKAMWLRYSKPLARPYEELSDYEKVMVDAFNSGEVSLDAFKQLEGADERRRVFSYAAYQAAKLHLTVCSLLEGVIATCLMCSAAFAGSAILAGLDVRAMRNEKLQGPFKGEVPAAQAAAAAELERQYSVGER